MPGPGGYESPSKLGKDCPNVTFIHALPTISILSVEGVKADKMSKVQVLALTSPGII